MGIKQTRRLTYRSAENRGTAAAGPCRRKRNRRSDGVEKRTIEAERGEDEDEVVEDTEPAEADEPLTAFEEEVEEEFEDLSRLPLPTWAELVASLYRPQDR